MSRKHLQEYPHEIPKSIRVLGKLMVLASMSLATSRCSAQLNVHGDIVQQELISDTEHRESKRSPRSFDESAIGSVELSKLAESREAWNEAKRTCKGNYTYEVTTASFTGYRTKTTITVENNKVVGREFQTYATLRANKPNEWAIEWTEAENDVGVHKSGAKAYTIDQLYPIAQEVLLRKHAAFERRHVQYDHQGILKACWWQNTQIVDDSPVHGVNVENLILAGKRPFDADGQFLSDEESTESLAAVLPDVLGGPLDRLDDSTYLASVEKTKLLAAEFTGDAELVIDSGGFIGEISDVDISPDGTLVAAAGDKVVRIWNVANGQLIATLRGDMTRTSYGNCNAVAFSSDGQRLLVGVSDYAAHGSIREYATDNFDEIKNLITGHTSPCRRIAFARNGSRRVTADADGNLLIHNLMNGTSRTIPPRNADKPIIDMVAYPDAYEGHFLAIDFEGPQVYSPEGIRLGPQDDLPDRLRGWMIDVFTKKIQYPFGSTKDPRVLDFAMEHGVWVATGSGKENGGNKFWAAVYNARKSGATNSPSIPRQVYSGHRWRINAVALAPTARGGNGLVVTGDKFGEVHVWDQTTGERIHRFQGQGKSIYEVGFDANSKRIAFGTRPYKPGVWNRNNYGAAKQVLDLHQRLIHNVDRAENLDLLGERPVRGTSSVSVGKIQGSANFVIQRRESGKTVSTYRLSSGRNPSVYSLLDNPILGITKPVLVGDNEGLLAVWDSSTDELRRAFIGHKSMVSAVSPSPNGKLIASASTDRTIRIWSLSDHESTGIFDFKFENTSVIQVKPGSSSARAGVQVGDQVLTIDGITMREMYDRMLMGKFDYKPEQTVRMKMKRGDSTYEYQMTMAAGYDFVDPVLSVYVGDDNQWIVWTPQGYYDASPGADRLIGWHVNRGPEKSARFFEVQQFRKQLYRPDIIDRILGGENVSDAIRIANEAKNIDVAHDFRSPSEIAEVHPPYVSIISPKADSKVRGRVNFRVRVESMNGLPIQEATLMLNGGVVKLFEPADVSESFSVEVSHDVELEDGDNQLAVLASNTSSRSDYIYVTVNNVVTQNDVRPDGYRPDAHVLVVGVSVDGSPNANSGKDAANFAQMVEQNSEGRIYNKVNVRLLADNDATREKILDGFQWLVDHAKPKDTVIIYYGSPAFSDSRDNFYLGANGIDKQRLRATAISWREFTDTLHEDLPSCQRVVFLDTHPTDGSIRPGMRNPLLDLALPERGTSFFCSNTLQQESQNTTKSRFVQAIIGSLKDKAVDRMPSPPDQLVNSIELASGIKSRLRQKAYSHVPVTYTNELIGRRNVLELLQGN